MAIYNKPLSQSTNNQQRFLFWKIIQRWLEKNICYGLYH